MRAQGLLSPPAYPSSRAASVSPSRGGAVPSAHQRHSGFLPCVQRHTRGSSDPLTDVALLASEPEGDGRTQGSGTQCHPAPGGPLSARALLRCPVPSIRDGHAAGLGHASWGKDLQTRWVACPAQRGVPWVPAGWGGCGRGRCGAWCGGGGGCRAEQRECSTQALCLARVGGSQGVRSEC